jgi:hypothetical protein
MKDIFQKRKFEQLKEIGSIQKFLQIRRKKWIQRIRENNFSDETLLFSIGK